MEIARLVLGVLLLVAFALLTVQLYNGRWLFLIAKPEKTKKGTFFPEGTANTGKRAAWVMVACFAVTATLMAYEMSKMTGVPAFAQTSSILNNIALVAFCLSLLWTLFAGRDARRMCCAALPWATMPAPQPSAFRCRGIPCEPTPATCTRSWISIRAKSSSTSSTAPPNVRRSADQTNRIESAVMTAQAPSSKTSRRTPSFLKRSR